VGMCIGSCADRWVGRKAGGRQAGERLALTCAALFCVCLLAACFPPCLPISCPWTGLLCHGKGPFANNAALSFVCSTLTRATGYGLRTSSGSLRRSRLSPRASPCQARQLAAHPRLHLPQPRPPRARHLPLAASWLAWGWQAAPWRWHWLPGSFEARLLPM